MDYSMENQEYGKPKKSYRWLIWVVVVLVIVFVGAGGIFYYKLSSQNSFKLLLKSAFDSLEEEIANEENQKSLLRDFSMDLNLQSENAADNEVFDLFNKLDLSGTYGIDYDKQIISFDLYSQYDKEDLLSMSLYTEYSKAYVYLNDLYDKYIEVSLDDYDSLFERNLDDSKNVIAGFEKALLESLKDEYFKKENVTLDSVKVTKTRLYFNKENYQEFKNNFVQKLLDNNDFMTSFANINEQSVSELKRSFEAVLEEDVDFEEEEMILYTKGAKFVQFEAIAENNKLVVKEAEGKYLYECYENNVLVYDGMVQVDEKEENSTMVVSFNAKAEGISFELSFDSSIKENGKVETKDVANSIYYENMTEDDIMTIYSKLLENDSIMKFIEEVSKLSGQDMEDSSSV